MKLAVLKVQEDEGPALKTRPKKVTLPKFEETCAISVWCPRIASYDEECRKTALQGGATFQSWAKDAISADLMEGIHSRKTFNLVKASVAFVGEAIQGMVITSWATSTTSS